MFIFVSFFLATKKAMRELPKSKVKEAKFSQLLMLQPLTIYYPVIELLSFVKYPFSTTMIIIMFYKKLLSLD